jgi:hypothetical protein
MYFKFLYLVEKITGLNFNTNKMHIESEIVYYFSIRSNFIEETQFEWNKSNEKIEIKIVGI